MPGWNLLIFHRNQPASLSRLLERTAPWIDRALIVEASDPQRLPPRLPGAIEGRARVLRVLPLGHLEPLRALAWRSIGTGRVLNLDVDEEPGDGLLRALPNLAEGPPWLLPRYERSIDAWTRHLRVYDAADIRADGWMHEAPRTSVEPRVGGRELAFEHTADYPNYARDRPEVITLEAWTRPFRTRSLRREFPTFARLGVLPGDRDVGRLTASLLLRSVRWRRFNELDSRSGRVRTGRFLERYLRARYAAYRALPPDSRAEIGRLGAALAEAGGPTPYLGLDDPAYVDRLTRNFPWDRSGAEAFLALLRHRLSTGHRLEAWPPVPVAA